MTTRRVKRLGMAALGGALVVLAGCHKDNSAATDPNDPAAANYATAADANGQMEAGAPQQGPPTTEQAPEASTATRARTEVIGQMPPPPPEDTQQQQPYADEYAQPGYASQANYDPSLYQSYDQPVYAEQPPPPLPEYDQPPCPGDNYEWTPGYWNYANTGYYWVPGVWVVAPFVGALWTPGWWGWESSRYAWHRGYWGPHIGYYGGINYGHGYFGHGYEGGYWNNNRFFYNRSVTHVTNNITNVYVHNVTVVNNRVSYNGGRGGINARPLPQEQYAEREQHVAPLPAQLQHVRAAEANRAQFVQGSNARPAQLVAAAAIAGHTAPSFAGMRTVEGRPAMAPARFGGAASGFRTSTAPGAGVAVRPNNAPAVRPGMAPATGQMTAPATGRPGMAPAAGSGGVVGRSGPNDDHRTAPGAPARSEYSANERGATPVQRQQPTPQARPEQAQRPQYQPQQRPEPQRPNYQPQQRPEQVQQPRPTEQPRSTPTPQAQPRPAAPAGGEPHGGAPATPHGGGGPRR